MLLQQSAVQVTRRETRDRDTKKFVKKTSDESKRERERDSRGIQEKRSLQPDQEEQEGRKTRRERQQEDQEESQEVSRRGKSCRNKRGRKKKMLHFFSIASFPADSSWPKLSHHHHHRFLLESPRVFLFIIIILIMTFMILIHWHSFFLFFSSLLFFCPLDLFINSSFLSLVIIICVFPTCIPSVLFKRRFSSNVSNTNIAFKCKVYLEEKGKKVNRKSGLTLLTISSSTMTVNSRSHRHSSCSMCSFFVVTFVSFLVVSDCFGE